MLDGLTSGIAIVGYFMLAFAAFLLWGERWTKRKYPDAWKPIFWWGFGKGSGGYYGREHPPLGWFMILFFLFGLYCIYVGLTGQQ
jgi:hypothetical protein